MLRVCFDDADLGKFMHRSFFRHRRLALACVFGLSAMSQQASAGNPLDSAWDCAKASAGGAANIGADLAKKAETIASMSGELGVCLGKSGADQTGFAITMGAITAIKLASPDTLPNGQCKPRIHGLLARPFAEGISAVMPASGAKDELIELIKSPETGEALWDQFSSLPPPVMTYASHVDCSCMLIDNAVSLADLSAVGNAIEDISENCSAFLDDAGLGFINDYGTAAIQWTGEAYSDASGWWDRSVLGQSKHADPDTVYQMYWGMYEVDQANQILTKGNGVLPWHRQSNVMAKEIADAGFASLGSGWSLQAENPGEAISKAVEKCYSGNNCTTSLGSIYSQCVTYYDNHTASKEHAQEWCTAMRDQRFMPAAQKLAKEFDADIRTRLLVEERLDVYHKQLLRWQWRMPRRPGYQPGDTFNGWTAQQTDNIALANLGHAQAFGAFSRGPWDYQLSGVFQAAREVLPNVGWDPNKATELAFKGVEPTIANNILKAWAEWSYWDKTSRLGEWLPTPPFGGKYGCPANGPLASACVGKVLNTYDKVCALPVRDAHLNAKDMLDLTGTGRRLDTVKKNCLSWIVPQTERAVLLSDPIAEVGGYTQEFCADLPSRSQEQQDCQRRVSDEWVECAVETYEAGKGADAARQCLADWARGYRARRMQGTRITPTPAPGSVQAPQAGEPIPGVTRLPPRPVSASAAPTPRDTPSASSATAPIRIGDPASQGGGNRPAPATPAAQPASPATRTVAPASAGSLRRLPARVEPQPCPEGEVQVTMRDGTKRCVAEARKPGP